MLIVEDLPTVDEVVSELTRLKGPPGLPSTIEDPARRVRVLRAIEELYRVFKIGADPISDREG